MSSKIRSDLHAVLEMNKRSYTVYCLLGLLEKLSIKHATYTHQDDVSDYLERQLIRMFGMRVICGS